MTVILENADIRSSWQIAIANNDTTYKGSPCKNGHSGMRYVNGRTCVECVKWVPTGRKVGGTANPQRLKAIENNEQYYFTGKSCRRGHTAKRFTSNAVCVECDIFHKSDGDKAKNYELIAKYGITFKDYEDLLKSQDGKCFICKQPETKLVRKKICKLAVDHCHDTGKIRGLLCYACNVGIGFFKHSSERLRNAALYCEVV